MKYSFILEYRIVKVLKLFLNNEVVRERNNIRKPFLSISQNFTNSSIFMSGNFGVI
jgi:hypothetical protein